MEGIRDGGMEKDECGEGRSLESLNVQHNHLQLSLPLSRFFHYIHSELDDLHGMGHIIAKNQATDDSDDGTRQSRPATMGRVFKLWTSRQRSLGPME